MGELDELRQEIEDLREEIESLKEDSEEDSSEDDEEDETRTLYIYIQHVREEKEVLGMTMEEREVLLLEEENSYQVPHEEEAEFASTTRQVVSYTKNLGIDAWSNIERIGEREDSVYYEVLIPEDLASEVNQGAWVLKGKATKLISDMEAREYL
jgi:hypothetical protein